MDIVLYLDFDGVLHHEAVYYHPRHGIYIKPPGYTLFDWMPILEMLLTPYPDVKIVLSTSWVRARSFSFAKKQLSPPLQARVIGATFHHREMHMGSFAAKPRGVQIVEDVARRNPNVWFALDDDDFGWPSQYADHLIRTDGAMGLNDQVVQQAIRKKLEEHR